MRCSPGEQIGLWAKDRDWLQWLLSTFPHREYLLHKLVPIHPLEELNVFITTTQMLNHGWIPKINRWVLYCATQLCFTRGIQQEYICHVSPICIYPLCVYAWICTVALWYTVTICLYHPHPTQEQTVWLIYMLGFFLGSCLTAHTAFLNVKFSYVFTSHDRITKASLCPSIAVE